MARDFSSGDLACLVSREQELARLGIPLRSIRLTPIMVADHPRRVQVARVFQNLRLHQILRAVALVKVVILSEHRVRAEWHSVVADLSVLDASGYHIQQN